MKKMLFSLVILIVFVAVFYGYLIYPHQIAVMQGYTDESQTRFVIVSEFSEIYCEAMDTSDGNLLITPSEEKNFSYKSSKNYVHHCNFTLLDIKKKYKLQVYNKNKILIAERFFKTLDLNKSKINIAIESCTSDIVHLPLLWDNLKDNNPDYIFMIGDNVYGDLFKDYTEISEEHLWERYIRSWKVFKIFQQSELTPTLGIWDDHDFGVNNGDSSYENKKFTLHLFRTFFNQNLNSSLINTGPGVTFSLSLKRNHFLFLDSRYFRDANSDFNGSYFSSEQIKWINQIVEKHPGEVFWLISGSQWFGTKGQDESFEMNHPEQVRHFLKSINFKKHNMYLISGDSHFSEIKKLQIDGKDLYEITSSGMHALPIGKIEPDHRRIEASNFPNFVFAEIDLNQNSGHSFTSRTLFNIKLFSVLIP